MLAWAIFGRVVKIISRFAFCAGTCEPYGFPYPKSYYLTVAPWSKFAPQPMTGGTVPVLAAASLAILSHLESYLAPSQPQVEIVAE
jgi:hypothetical protein